MPRTVPQVVVNITAGQVQSNFRGAYSSSVTYVPGQWVVQGEVLYSCLKASTNNEPKENSEFWVTVGSIT